LASHLATKISSGQLLPGELLPSERVLAEEYGLSRSMVREALRTLAERRLIDVLPGRGSVVRQATAEDAARRLIDVFDHRGVTPRHLIEARSMIETTAAGLAAERATVRDLQNIIVANEAINRADLVLERVRWDLAFHVAIVKSAHNPMVETMFHALQPYIVELLLRSLTDSEVTEQGLAFHERIVEAIESSNSPAARDEMRGHLTLGLTLFGDDIDRNLNLVAQDALRRIPSVRVSFEEVLRLTMNPG
jgi:DNA-binding FadR family transcriptional regulator